MKRKVDFGTKKFLSMLSTASVGMVINFVMLLAGTIIAGRFFGETGLAAVNLVLPIFSLTAFLSILISYGTELCFTYEVGRFNKQRADEYFGQGLILSLATGIVLCVLVFLGEGIFLSVMNPSVEILTLTKEYYRFYPFIALVYPFYSYLVDMVYSDGDELICNISYGIQIVSNLALAILLCSRVGIGGISLASLIGTVLSTVVLLFHFIRKTNGLHFVWFCRFEEILHVVKFGITDGIQYLCNGLLVFVLNTYILVNFDANYLAVLTVIVGCVELTIIFDGIGQAFAPIVNMYRGENNSIGIKKVMYFSVLVGIVEGIVVTVLSYIFIRQIPSAMGVSDPLVFELSVNALRIFVLSFVFMALKYLITSYYLIFEKLGLSVSITLVSDLIIPIVIGIPLSKLIGINGIWIGLALAAFTSLIFGFVVVGVRYGFKKYPFLIDFSSIKNVFSESMMLSDENIIEIRNHAEQFLYTQGIKKNKILSIMLHIEEMLIAVEEKNPDKKVCVECSLVIDEGITLIIKDNGEMDDVVNISEVNGSINSKVLSRILMMQKDKANLTTMGFNRNEVKFSID